MRKVFLHIAVLLLLGSCSKKEDDTLRVVTGDVTDITEFSAVLHGYGYPPERLGHVVFGFFVSTKDNPSEGNGHGVLAFGGRKEEMEKTDYEYTKKITDLHPGTTYYYRAYTYVTWTLGEVKSFETKPLEASVDLLPVTVEGQNSVCLNARLVTPWMEHAKKAFFIIFTQKEYVIWEVESGRQENWSLAPLQSDGSFSLLLTKQKPGVEYYYIAGTLVYDRLFYSDIGTFSIPVNS